MNYPIEIMVAVSSAFLLIPSIGFWLLLRHESRKLEKLIDKRFEGAMLMDSNTPFKPCHLCDKPAEQPSLTCPMCGTVTHDPNEIRYRFCSKCHVFIDDYLADDYVFVPNLKDYLKQNAKKLA